MKAKLFLLLTISFLFGSLHAQNIRDSLIFAQSPDFVGEAGKFLDAKGGMLLDKASPKLLKIPAPEAKKVGIPPATKKSKKPVVLRHEGNCYIFSCGKGKECSDCNLYWWDRNKDGKVQPRRELRCACPSARARCKINVRKIKCQ